MYTSESNRTQIATQMQFDSLPYPVTKPRIVDVQRMDRLLQQSSCAVVGASSALRMCNRTRDICKHDVVIQVNHKRLIPCGKRRVDVQVVNAFACMQPLTCDPPKLFRLRTEWNPHHQHKFAIDGAWLQSGVLTTYTRDVLTNRVPTARCCNTAGGTAVALALKMCKSVSLYGLGGVRLGYVNGPRRAHLSGVHNLQGEAEWYEFLHEHGHVYWECKPPAL